MSETFVSFVNFVVKSVSTIWLRLRRAVSFVVVDPAGRFSTEVNAR
jgi:hypothetical protein